MEAQAIGAGDPPLRRRAEEAPTVVVSPSAGTSEDLPPYRSQQMASGDLGDLLLLIWRRKIALLAFVATAIALCVFAVLQMTPLYTAQGLVLVDAPQTRIVNLEAVLSGTSAEADAVESEIEVLHSPALAGAVVDRLSLVDVPEFNAELREPSLWAEVRRAIEGVFDLLPFGSDAKPQADPPSAEELAAAERADVINSVLGNLTISGRERSRLLDVAFTSEDPSLATDIVNAFLDLYIADQVERKYTATLGAAEWLSRNVASWQQRTLDSERKIEEFRSRADLLEGENGVLLMLRQISEANDQLTRARMARSAAEARLRQVRQYGVDATLGAPDDLLRSAVMQRLRDREAELMAMEAETLTRYGPDHRRAAAIRAELQNVRGLMAAEIDRVIRGLEVDIARSASVEQGLGEILGQLKAQVAAANLARVELDALRRDADANRRILDVFTSRLAETRGQADRGLLQPDASIIAHADVPLVASYPKPKLFLALALVLAIGAGLTYIFLSEWLRRGFCSGDEIEQATGKPVLGLLPPLRGWLPKVSALRHGKVSMPTFGHGHRALAVDRSVRWLGNRISLHDDKPRVILLTSALAGEGKTTAATALAAVLARGHGRIVVVEADLCRCRALPASPGLRDLLVGAVSLDAAIRRDDRSGVYTLPAGTADLQHQETLPWPAFEPLLADLRRQFDWVIVDGPSILQSPETRLLARLADATIFVVKWGATDRRLVAAGLDQIEQSGGRTAGILLTMVNARKYARYSQRDSYRFLFDGGKRCAH